MDMTDEEAKRVISATIPELRECLAALWGKYQPQFGRASDRCDWLMEGGAFGLVQFTHRSMLLLWLTGFAGKASQYSYAGILWMHQIYSIKFILSDIDKYHEQKKFDDIFDKLLNSIKELSSIENLAAYSWPKYIPQPDLGKPNDVENAVVFDLVCMASTFLFLHEVHHIQIKDDGVFQGTPQEEEIQCDSYAMNFILDNSDLHAQDMGYPTSALYSKRAMAISLGFGLILIQTPKQKWGITDKHPAIRNRLLQLINKIRLPDNDDFWYYTASLLISILRSSDAPPRDTTFKNMQDLVTKIVSDLPEINQ